MSTLDDKLKDLKLTDGATVTQTNSPDDYYRLGVSDIAQIKKAARKAAGLKVAE